MESIDITKGASEFQPSGGSEFQNYWLIVKRQWLPASVVFTLVLISTVLMTLSQQPIYQAEGKLRLTRRDASTVLTGVGQETGQVESLVDTNNPLTTEIGVIETIPIIQSVIDQMHLEGDQGVPLTPSQFLKNLKVSNPRGTDIIVISYTDPDPKKAEQIVDLLMNVYVEEHLLDKRSEAASAKEFIEQQLPSAEAVVRRAEAALRDFKEQNQVPALEQETQSSVAAVSDLQRQIGQSQAELSNLETQYRAIQSQLGLNNVQSGTVIAALSQSEGVQQVLTELQEVESQLATERGRYQDQSPVIRSLLSRRTNLAGLLGERVEQVVGSRPFQPNANLQAGELQIDLIRDLARTDAQRRGLANQITSLSRTFDNYKQRVSAFPRLEQEQRELQRQLDAAQTTYNLLLQRLQEVRVAEKQNVGNVRIIQPAAGDNIPIEPKKSLALIAGVLLGSLLGGLAAFILESRDRSIKTIKEAKAIFGLTVLGVIPTFGKQKKGGFLNRSEDDLQIPEVIVRDHPRSMVSESYRMLQSNLKYLNSDQPIKVIVITSSLAGEGKSTVAANLAAAMAQAGQKVLLVDADLHQPTQHRIWDIPNYPGLSNVLVGETAPAAGTTEAMTHLEILSAGVLPPNPAALLDSQRMNSLIETWKRNYDFVVVDTPALSASSSASILGKMTDGLLLVVRPTVADAASAALTKTILGQSQQQVLGQVVNGVIASNEPYGHHLFKEYSGETNRTENHSPIEAVSNRLR
jgi:polysaccharide biosynthesis transport protein